MTADIALFRRQVTESLLKLQRSQRNDLTSDDATEAPDIRTASGFDSAPRDDAINADSSPFGQHVSFDSTGLARTSPTPPSAKKTPRDEKRLRRQHIRSTRRSDNNDDVIGSNTSVADQQPEVNFGGQVAAGAAVIQGRFTSFSVMDILGLMTSEPPVERKLMTSSTADDSKLCYNNNTIGSYTDSLHFIYFMKHTTNIERNKIK